MSDKTPYFCDATESHTAPLLIHGDERFDGLILSAHDNLTNKPLRIAGTIGDLILRVVLGTRFPLVIKNWLAGGQNATLAVIMCLLDHIKEDSVNQAQGQLTRPQAKAFRRIGRLVIAHNWEHVDAMLFRLWTEDILGCDDKIALLSDNDLNMEENIKRGLRRLLWKDVSTEDDEIFIVWQRGLQYEATVKLNGTLYMQILTALDHDQRPKRLHSAQNTKVKEILRLLDAGKSLAAAHNLFGLFKDIMGCFTSKQTTAILESAANAYRQRYNSSR